MKNLVLKIKIKFNNLSNENKSVLTLVGGTGFSQLINFIFAPILTRIYTPEVFGDLAVYDSIISIFTIIICLRYENSIILPENNNEGFSLYKISIFFSLIICFFINIFLVFWGKYIFKLFKAPALYKYWYFISINLLFNGIIQASNFWLVRKGKFKIISIYKVIQVIVINLTSIILGLLFNSNLIFLLLSALLSYLASITIVLNDIIPDFRTYKISDRYFPMILRYKNFLLYDTWSSLINSLSWIIVPVLMNYYYGNIAAGQYSIGLRVIQIPSSLIGASITQVFIKIANDKKYEQNLYDYSKKTIKKLFLYTSPFAIIMLFFGKSLFRLIFGKMWETAGIYSQILAAWALVWFCSSPISTIYIILQKQNILLIFTILNLITRFISLYLGKILGNDILGILFFSISGIIVYSLILIFALILAKRNDKKNENK